MLDSYKNEGDSVVVGTVCNVHNLLSFGLWLLWFGIVWCWQSISCFRLFASLPYMSIRARIVVAVDSRNF